MFTIVLLNKDNEIMQYVSMQGNETYLEQQDESYPYLSELCSLDVDVFNSDQMNELICELEKLKKSLLEVKNIAHVASIIDLAKQCRENRGYCLEFNPFINSTGSFTK